MVNLQSSWFTSWKFFLTVLVSKDTDSSLAFAFSNVSVSFSIPMNFLPNFKAAIPVIRSQFPHILLPSYQDGLYMY